MTFMYGSLNKAGLGYFFAVYWRLCLSMCVFLPVCSAHQSPVPHMVRHGSHWAADACHSSAQTGVGTACSSVPLPLVSRLVDRSSLCPVSACRLRRLLDVKVAGALVAELSWPAGLLWNHLDSVARSGSHGHFLAGRWCCDGKKLGCDGGRSHGLLQKMRRCGLGVAQTVAAVVGLSVLAGLAGAWRMKEPPPRRQWVSQVFFLGCKWPPGPQRGCSHWFPNHWSDS